MQKIIESNWIGWNPSADSNANPAGQQSLELIKMKNLNLDEKGIVRNIKGPTQVCTNQFTDNDVYGIFSTILNGVKTRFVYLNAAAGHKLIKCTSTDSTDLDTELVDEVEGSIKCSFLNVLGRTIMCAGAIKQKYDGVNNLALGIAKPDAPTIAANATYSVSLDNLDGSSHYTNWTSISSATFDNTSTLITGTGAAAASKLANELIFQTVFSSVKDTTNLNGTGKDTDDDTFQFIFEIDDDTQLAWVRIELFMDTPPTANNYFWKEWDFLFNTTDPNNPYYPFPISKGIETIVQLKRKDWFSVGEPSWKAVKAIRVTVGISDSSAIKFKTFKVMGGTDAKLSGEVISYVVVHADNATGWYEFSPASNPVSVTGLTNQSVTITPYVDPMTMVTKLLPDNANEYWIFRQDTLGGLYYRVQTQHLDYDGIPVAYTDFRALDDLILEANINPFYNLQAFRTALPTYILDLIWFRDRVIYLTSTGFVPSFKGDPGSYDSRFIYEVVGSNNEICLFIAKLDVGTFIIATTTDFYRITGTFATQFDPNDPTGSIVFQDVTITPLGVKNPAITHNWVEFQGSIFYIAADGIRILFNATSTLVNGVIDLLFRGEVRYGLHPISIATRDLDFISIASIGDRIYFLLSHNDGLHRIYVLKINDVERSWRLIDLGSSNTDPYALFREEDGHILFAGKKGTFNYVQSLESDQNNDIDVPIEFLTKYNYGSSNLIRKDALTFKTKVNTNNQDVNVIIKGLLLDGSIQTHTFVVTAQNDDIVEINLNGFLPPCLAYAVEIDTAVRIFKLQWFFLAYEEHPLSTMRVIQYLTNYGTTGRKRIAKLPFRANLRGSTIQVRVTIDGTNYDQNFTDSDVIKIFNFIPNDDLLGVDWAIEITVTSGPGIEFYEWIPPVITQECPPLIHQYVFPVNNFDSAARKRISNWPFMVNLRGHACQILFTVDGLDQTALTFTPTSNDLIQTIDVIPHKDLFGVDWQLKVTCDDGMEFYKVLPPVMGQVFPVRVNHAIQPSTNFGKGGPKEVSVWPFMANAFYKTLYVKVTVDGVEQTLQEIYNRGSDSTTIETFFWRNTIDIKGVDWQIEVYAKDLTDDLNDLGGEFEFYKFLPPELLQIFPVAKRFDQIGPIDFNKEGIVYGARFRIMGIEAGQTVNYDIFDADDNIYTGGIVANAKDVVYNEKFPKGVNISTFKMSIYSAKNFYRFSVELKVRITGMDTEEKFIMVPDANSK